MYACVLLRNTLYDGNQSHVILHNDCCATSIASVLYPIVILPITTSKYPECRAICL